MEPFQFIKKHKVLSILFLISIGIIVSVDFIFSDIPAFWKHAIITGQIFSNLAHGYILSLIFYFLVVYLKEKKDQKNISKRVSKAITLILFHGDSLETMIYKGQPKKSRAPEEIKKICKKTNLFDINYSKGHSKSNWVEYLKMIDQETKYYLDKLFKLNNIDSNLIRILTDIEDSSMLASSKLIPSKEGTMEPLAPCIIQFFEILDELEKYWIANYSHFQEHKAIRRS